MIVMNIEVCSSFAVGALFFFLVYAVCTCFRSQLFLCADIIQLLVVSLHCNYDVRISHPCNAIFSHQVKSPALRDLLIATYNLTSIKDHDCCDK
jgi:hypothetical protein